MSTGYRIQGTHVADFLSRNVSETVTIGNTGLATTMRIYDCNAPLNGYLITTSNGIFTINQANSAIPTCVGIGTTVPNRAATLHVQGTLYTSYINTYDINNTIYFNNTTTNINTNLSGINNINVQGTTNTIGNGTSTLTLGNKTGGQEVILADIPTAQWKISTYGTNLRFYNDYSPTNTSGGIFNTNPSFYINQNGATGSLNNQFDDGSGNMNIAGTLSVTGNTTVSGNMNIPGTLSVTGNTTVSGTLTSQNIVCGSTITTLTVSANLLTINMNNESYNIFTCTNPGANIQKLTIQNIIPGAQAIIYITTNAAITIYGNVTNILTRNDVTTATLKIAHSPVSLISGNTAILMITNDGTNNYINCSKFL